MTQLAIAVYAHISTRSTRSGLTLARFLRETHIFRQVNRSNCVLVTVFFTCPHICTMRFCVCTAHFPEPGTKELYTGKLTAGMTRLSLPHGHLSNGWQVLLSTINIASLGSTRSQPHAKTHRVQSQLARYYTAILSSLLSK